jgi:Kef-type K+ transport system membrane component KefB
VSFGVLTFSFPMLFGTVVGLALGWDWAAALLLGSLLASHTLVIYPVVRGAGLASDPVIASAVGATVLTDTLALIVLAVIAGTTSGSGSGTEVAVQLAVGLAVLGVVCFVVLPWLARRAFRLLGTERTVRYVIAVAAFLIAAVTAQTFGIEGIVGAFFAGLAMNRLVPNEGPLMNRIDFFGAAVFVPVFLVSVGLLLDPAVMLRAETLALAGLFIAACLGGKLVAAVLTRPLLGADGAQAAIVYALTIPKAAATLAATTVGFSLGLFSESVVNAVLVLILVSVLVATLVAERRKGAVKRPAPRPPALGEQVLVAVADVDGAPLGLRLARAVADREAGVVEVALLAPAGGAADERTASLDRLRGLCRRLGIDTDPSVRTTDQLARTVLLAARDHRASLVIAVVDGRDGHWAQTLSFEVDAPVAIVRGHRDRPLHAVRIAPPAGAPGAGVAIDLAAVVPARAERIAPAGHLALEPGDVMIAAISGWEQLGELQPPEGAALVIVPDGLLPAARAEAASAAPV